MCRNEGFRGKTFGFCISCRCAWMERCTIWRFGGRDRPGRGQGAARYQTTRALDVDRGVSNLGNKGYQLLDGYPTLGRSYYLNVGYRF